MCFCLSLRRPRHSLRATGHGKKLPKFPWWWERETFSGDVCYHADFLCEVFSKCNRGPVWVVKQELARTQKLLQSPSSFEPPTACEWWVARDGRRRDVVNIFQIGEANVGFLVPSEHRVDSLGELGAAGLIDTDYVTRTEFSGAICRTVIPC